MELLYDCMFLCSLSKFCFWICSGCIMFRGYSITPRNFCSFVVFSILFPFSFCCQKVGGASGRRKSIPTALDDIPPSAGAGTRREHNPIPIANKTVILFLSVVGWPKGSQWRYLYWERGGFGGARGIEQNKNFVQFRGDGNLRLPPSSGFRAFFARTGLASLNGWNR